VACYIKPLHDFVILGLLYNYLVSKLLEKRNA
jgi:hypothetical protein